MANKLQGRPQLIIQDEAKVQREQHIYRDDRNGKTVIWGIGFTDTGPDRQEEVRRILGQLQGMTPQTIDLYRQGCLEVGGVGEKMYMVWYCQWYP